MEEPRADQHSSAQEPSPINGTDFTLSAPAQSGILARFAQGTLVPTGSVTKINYVEDNGNGTTSAYEYIM